MADGCLPSGPIFGNIIDVCNALETKDPDPLRETVHRALGKPGEPTFDVLVGGWPCQGISCAGLCLGLDDVRSGLFFALARLLKIYQPPYFFFENVGSISGDTNTWSTVLKTLTIDLPYRVDWIIIPVPSLVASEYGKCAI